MSLRGTNRRPSAATIAAWSIAAAVLGSAGLSYGQAGTPFGGVPFLIPARGEAKLEAVNFDRGAEGVAYHDSDAINAGRQCRPDDGVDIGLCNDTGGGYRVGWIAPGEWMKYTVRVSTAGKHNILFRVSSRAANGAMGGKLHLEDANGTNLTGEVNVPGTGDTWQDVRVNGVPLAAGDQALKVVFDSGGFNFSYMVFSPAPVETTPQAPVAQAQVQAAAPQEVVVINEEPVNVPATSRLGAFAEENTIGSEAAKGQLAYTEPGTYTLRGGSKVGGKADGVYLVSNKIQGDGQLVARVESVEGSGSAGVMYRESAGADASFAAVLVTAGNGTFFQRRSETGGSVLSAMALGAKPPVWIRLVRSGDNFSAFYSGPAEQPGEGDWKPIGTSKPVTMSEIALAGLASAAGEGSAKLTSVSAGGAVAAAPEQAEEIIVAGPAAGAKAGQLTGRVIGTEGSYSSNGNTREKAFDGDLSTYFDPPQEMATTAWTGLDFGSARRITRIAFCPRSGYGSRVVNARFQASNSPTFGAGTVDLFTITTAPPEGQLATVDVHAPGAYRYFRYAGGTGHVSISEIQVFGDGTGAAGIAATALPASGAALSGSVADTEGSAINLTALGAEWVHWGHNRQTNRKAGVPCRIGDISGDVMYFNDNHVKYSWTDGNPMRRVDSTAEAVFRQSPAFSFTVRPGDARVHTLTVYVGGSSSTGEFTATVPGTAPYTDRGRGNVNEHYYFAYTLQLRVATPEDAVSIEWKQSGGGGNIQLHAATFR